jgi:hypothetical protein
MVHTIHAAASYGSSNPPGTSLSSKLKPTIPQSMEDRLATWNEKQAQKNSPVNLMSIEGETSSHFEEVKDFSHEASLEFTVIHGLSRRFKNKQLLQNIKFTEKQPWVQNTFLGYENKMCLRRWLFKQADNKNVSD